MMGEETLIKQLLTKYQFSRNCPQISHTHKNRYFNSVIGRKLNSCFYPINFMALTCKESTFPLLAV